MTTLNKGNNESVKQESSSTNSLFYHFEHGERLKAEKEERERKQAQFAKTMAKFGPGDENEKKSVGAVNQKAQMFVDITKMDPGKEKAELERKVGFERKIKGFQTGSETLNKDKNDLKTSEVSKKTKMFTRKIEDQSKDDMEEKSEIEKQKREFKEKSKFLDATE